MLPPDCCILSFYIKNDALSADNIKNCAVIWQQFSAIRTDQLFKIFTLISANQSIYLCTMPLLICNIILCSFWTAYLLVWLILRLRSTVHDNVECLDNQPTVSILIPIHNEGQHLSQLFKSLDRLLYPQALTQILLADDASTDGSDIQIQNFCNLRPNADYILSKNINGKAVTLSYLTEQATGEILFFTDGDCVVPANWITDHVDYYGHSKIGLVGGLVVAQGGHSLFSKLQAVDWLRFSAAGSIWARLGAPLSIFGNHFSIRRETLTAAGGFAAAARSVTEDYMLMSQVLNKTDWTVGFLPLQPGHVVFTAPEDNGSAFFKQRKRWAVGARGRSACSTFLTGLNLLPIPLFLLLSFCGHPLTALFSLLAYLILEKTLTQYWQERLQIDGIITAAWLHPLFFFLYGAALIPSYLFLRKIQWKGRTQTVR